jgi:chromate transport protein ChrA
VLKDGRKELIQMRRSVSQRVFSLLIFILIFVAAVRLKVTIMIIVAALLILALFLRKYINKPVEKFVNNKDKSLLMRINKWIIRKLYNIK